jgi:hypothetical protein
MKTLRHAADGAAPARTRSFLRRLSLSLVTLAFAVFAASALAGSHAAQASFVINGSITNGDPVTTNPWGGGGSRFTCVNVGRAVTQASGTFHYDVYQFEYLGGSWNLGQYSQQGASTCVSVSLKVFSGTAGATAYFGAYDPTDPDFDFLAGAAPALGTGQAADFSFNLGGTAQRAPFSVVVFETIQNGGATYTLLVEGTGVIMSGSGTPTSADGVQSFRASAAPKGVLVRWRTRAEHEALGFNVYRGAVKKVRLTRSIVRASGDGRGHTYSYLDRSARKAKEAPYYLEVVQRSGSKIMFGPARFAR